MSKIIAIAKTENSGATKKIKNKFIDGIEDGNAFSKSYSFDINGYMVNSIKNAHDGTLNEINNYDDRGNEIYIKFENGLECWKKYDEYNRLIHIKHSTGYKEWTMYSQDGSKTKHTESSENDLEIEMWKYDSNGNLIRYINSNGYEYTYEYDSNNNLIKYKDSDGYEYTEDYDENNNLIHHKDNNGFEFTNEYDSNNNLIHHKDNDGDEESWKYDSNGNCIYYENSCESSLQREYDENNNLIYQLDNLDRTDWCCDYGFFLNCRGTTRCNDILWEDSVAENIIYDVEKHGGIEIADYSKITLKYDHLNRLIGINTMEDNKPLFMVLYNGNQTIIKYLDELVIKTTNDNGDIDSYLLVNNDKLYTYKVKYEYYENN